MVGQEDPEEYLVLNKELSMCFLKLWSRSGFLEINREVCKRCCYSSQVWKL